MVVQDFYGWSSIVGAVVGLVSLLLTYLKREGLMRLFGLCLTPIVLIVFVGSGIALLAGWVQLAQPPPVPRTDGHAQIAGFRSTTTQMMRTLDGRLGVSVLLESSQRPVSQQELALLQWWIEYPDGVTLGLALKSPAIMPSSIEVGHTVSIYLETVAETRRDFGNARLRSLGFDDIPFRDIDVRDPSRPTEKTT